MFTGLIETTGRTDAIDVTVDGAKLWVRTPLAADLGLGDSIAVNGVCLTVTARDEDRFSADISPVTLSVTTLGGLRVGRLVNLERPLRADARMGGHFVLGHVDAVGRVVEMRPDGDAHRLVVEVPAALAPLVIPKGSIAIDGISLTIAAVDDVRITAQIIPFTLDHTTLSQVAAGDAVNLEADVLGKYVLQAVGKLGMAPVVAS